MGMGMGQETGRHLERCSAWSYHGVLDVLFKPRMGIQAGCTRAQQYASLLSDLLKTF